MTTSGPVPGNRVSPLESGELKRAKRAVRRTVLGIRDAIPPAERERLAGPITARFLDLPEVVSARSVMAFSSFGSEVPTIGVIDGLLARGVLVLLPAIVDGELEARRYEPGGEMTPTSFGALEPVGDAIDPTVIDVVCTPAVAFDRSGNRVGYGGGFYDRFLPRTRPDTVRAGLAFERQVVDEELPLGRSDQRVDVVVTESETIRCRRDR
jgi:5-formyltetrahydrofolate cyclo-ligase